MFLSLVSLSLSLSSLSVCLSSPRPRAAAARAAWSLGSGGRGAKGEALSLSRARWSRPPPARAPWTSGARHRTEESRSPCLSGAARKTERVSTFPLCTDWTVGEVWLRLTSPLRGVARAARATIRESPLPLRIPGYPGRLDWGRWRAARAKNHLSLSLVLPVASPGVLCVCGVNRVRVSRFALGRSRAAPPPQSSL